jgi:hypothetical protein
VRMVSVHVHIFEKPSHKLLTIGEPFVGPVFMITTPPHAHDK